ncbi:MAG: lipopolysaccharide heptosyltransferase II [Xanthobacteraceae bacterium]
MDASYEPPILIVPYMWIGDFVRCHTVVKLLRERFPHRSIDLLSTATVAPLIKYMPGVRQGIVVDLPRKQLAFRQHRRLAQRLREQSYGTALIMPRTWKSALAPYLAGIPVRTAFLGEARFGIVNDMRFGERRLPRMVDRCAALALHRGEQAPAEWPLPELIVPAAEVLEWRAARGLLADHRRLIALAPGAVGPAKRWPYYAELARSLAAEESSVWIVGGPAEREAAVRIAEAGGANVKDLTGNDLRDAVLALAAADAAVSNDSGLLHVAAALGTPAVGIFGPTSPWHWAPLNPLAGVIERAAALPCRPCHEPVCRLNHHDCMRTVAADVVMTAIRKVVADRPPRNPARMRERPRA